jgi:hypothetical protein
MLQFYKIKIILFIYIYMYEISGVPSYHNYQLLNNSFNQKKKNSLFKYILFIIAIILFLLISYKYQKNYLMIYKNLYDSFIKYTKKYKKNNDVSNNEYIIKKKIVLTPNINELENNDKYIDNIDWDYEEECSNTSCPDLRCLDGTIVLREKNECCRKCVQLDQNYDSESIIEKQERKLRELNKFIEKKKKDDFKLNAKIIGRNTTKVTFSLIDRLLGFDYSNFNLYEFMKIFTKEDEYIYVGIIFIILGLLFTFLDFTDDIKLNSNNIKLNSNNIKGNVTLPPN